MAPQVEKGYQFAPFSMIREETHLPDLATNKMRDKLALVPTMDLFQRLSPVFFQTKVVPQTAGGPYRFHKVVIDS
jgi:hypothetical protein